MTNLRKKISNTWEKTTLNIKKWFTIEDEEVEKILTKVKRELPTTEALLIGKSQAGKSSIVRGLTGVCDEIVGQGFKPHTQHTQQYSYPSEDLPLLIFTDTVGLGDINQDTGAIIDELIKDLPQENQRARIFILTIKINDFATDTLKQILQKLKQTYPKIPCLLALTCLHEIYPLEMENHPPYPPDFPEINRALNNFQDTFKDLYDDLILIDFTLEEDDYNPVFYGLEMLRDKLAQLLPEAEARTIYELIDKEKSRELGNIYRDTARRYILSFSIMATTVAAVPLPFATMPVLTALQVSLVTLLGKLYGQILTPSQAGGIVSAIAGGFLAQMVGRELIKFIPGLGSVIAASWAGAYTWALGEGACVYFGDLMGGKKPDPQKIQRVMEDAFSEAKDRLKKKTKRE
jgi:uncharacterized protein (DUF697 family)/GTP-binding protein EngB required for normal cell division